MSSLLRRSIAELVGTFALVFIGVGSGCAKYYPDANYALYGIATAHAIVLAVRITATMAISGGHRDAHPHRADRRGGCPCPRRPLLTAAGGVPAGREPARSEGRRLRGRAGAMARHPGGRAARRGRHEPPAGVRAGAGGRAVGGAH